MSERERGGRGRERGERERERGSHQMTEWSLSAYRSSFVLLFSTVTV